MQVQIVQQMLLSTKHLFNNPHDTNYDSNDNNNHIPIVKNQLLLLLLLSLFLLILLLLLLQLSASQIQVTFTARFLFASVKIYNEKMRFEKNYYSHERNQSLDKIA